MPTRASISTSGASLTYYNMSVTNSTSKQTVLTQTIQSNSFTGYRPFIFDIVFDVTTPTVGVLPTVTINIELNGVAYTVSSAALAALSLTNRRFKIKGSLTAVSDDMKTLMLDGEIRQYGGLVLAGTNTNTSFFNDFTNVNTSADISFAVTIQQTSLLGGVSILLKKAIIGMN